MWKGQGRSGYGESSTGGDYDDWSCLSRNGRQWKNPATMLTRDLSGADYWHVRKQMTDSYDVPLEVYAENDTVNLAHTLPNGKANLLAYADKAPVVKSKVSIKDRILPQAVRVEKLTEQMRELEIEYKSGKMSIQDYTLYRSILSVKRSRAEVLLKKAISVRPTPHEDDEYADEAPEVEAETTYTINDRCVTSAPVATPCGVGWIDELTHTNSFKRFLQIACKVVVKLVQFSQRAKAYYQTLKEV